MSREVRVAVFTDNDFEKVNGVTTTLSALLRYAPRAVRPRVYTASALGAESPDYLALRACGMPIPFYGTMQMHLPPLRGLLAHARRDRIDVVHLTTPGPMGLAAAYAAWRLSVPMVGSFHTDLAAYAELLSGSRSLAIAMRRYMRWLYGRCQSVMVPSGATRQLVVDSGIDAAKVTLWTRGVDTGLFSPARRCEALRSAWHVSDRRPALLFVGRVSAEKGLDQLPALSRHLFNRGVQHRWIIAGDGPYRQTLEREMPDAHFAGTLSREDVARAFASADLFVFPSRTDTAGNVVLEAQASGLPVVVSDAGGPHENMTDGVTGAVCNSVHPESWADVVARLVASPERLARMGAAAVVYARSRNWAAALAPAYRTYVDAARTSLAHARGAMPLSPSHVDPHA